MAIYSATVTHSFWFSEFKQYVDEINKGKTPKEIKSDSDELNSFLQSSTTRAKRMISVVSKRVGSLTEEERMILSDLDLGNKKILNLISIFKTNQLFFEFVYTVYSDAILMRKSTVGSAEARKFIDDMKMQNEVVANWTESTVKRMAGIYRTFLFDAGLISSEDNVLQPIIDAQLRQLLLDEHLDKYLKALGERV